MMISVITATYNRQDLLGRLYHSLLQQTCYQFEWLIVDDGSTDHTEEIVQEYRNSTEQFSISYYKQVNGGKHRALNHGVIMSEGEFVFIVDSDDYLSHDAIEKAVVWCEEIAENRLLAGVAGLKADQSTKKAIGGNGKFKGRYIVAGNLERKKYRLWGDKAEIYKTEIMKKYPFPEFENENFITEDAVWNRIAHEGYKLRWYGDIIYFASYLEDGLTCAVRNKKILLDNFKGYSYVQCHNFQYYRSWKTKCIIFSRYYHIAKEKNITVPEACIKFRIPVILGRMMLMAGNIMLSITGTE